MLTVVTLATGPLLARVTLVVTLALRLPRFVSTLTSLVLLVLTVPAYWAASFGAGMALADAFGISGADHSPWALVLYTASLLALTLLVVQTALLTARLTRRSRPGSAPTGPARTPRS